MGIGYSDRKLKYDVNWRVMIIKIIFYLILVMLMKEENNSNEFKQKLEEEYIIDERFSYSGKGVLRESEQISYCITLNTLRELEFAHNNFRAELLFACTKYFQKRFSQYL